MSVASAASWDRIFQLDEFSKHEILFWKENIVKLNGRNCFLHREPNCFVYSDASETGCGSVITLNQSQVCHKMWDVNERCKSSTWRELAAIEFALRSFADILRCTHVKWYTDNRAVPTIVDVGSMKLELQKIAISIFELCIAQTISIDIQWILCEANVRADFISRLIDPDDWQITDALFKQLEAQ
jgi:hypothetical protein